MHNEIGNVDAVAASAIEAGSRFADQFEVLLVDDGSTDGTSERIDELAAAHPEVRAIHHPRNRGYGGALQSGIRNSRMEWIFYSDGDNQFDLAEISKLLPLLDRADIVSGYRERRRDAAHRILFAWIFRQVTHALFGVNLKDPDCAFKIYDASIFREMELTSEGAMIDVEILSRARRAGARIAEVGVSHRAREYGDSSGGRPDVVFRAAGEMWRLWWALRKTPGR